MLEVDLFYLNFHLLHEFCILNKILINRTLLKLCVEITKWHVCIINGVEVKHCMYIYLYIRSFKTKEKKKERKRNIKRVLFLFPLLSIFFRVCESHWQQKCESLPLWVVYECVRGYECVKVHKLSTCNFNYSTQSLSWNLIQSCMVSCSNFQQLKI